VASAFRRASDEITEDGGRYGVVLESVVGAQRSLCASEEIAIDEGSRNAASVDLGGALAPVFASDEPAQDRERREVASDSAGGAHRSVCASAPAAWWVIRFGNAVVGVCGWELGPLLFAYDCLAQKLV
jgi:hypothetical protein